ERFQGLPYFDEADSVREFFAGLELGAFLRNKRAADDHRGNFLSCGLGCLALQQIVKPQLRLQLAEVEFLLPTCRIQLDQFSGWGLVAIQQAGPEAQVHRPMPFALNSGLDLAHLQGSRDLMMVLRVQSLDLDDPAAIFQSLNLPHDLKALLDPNQKMTVALLKPFPGSDQKRSAAIKSISQEQTVQGQMCHRSVQKGPPRVEMGSLLKFQNSPPVGF